MSEAASSVTSVQRMKMGESVVKGRLESIVRVQTAQGDVFEHTVRLAAADEYSMPAVIEVRADRRLGQVGGEVTSRVQIGGFPRKPFRVVDKNTGEERLVKPVQVTLTAID